MLAFNNVLVNLDSYSGKFSHNYYLYQDEWGIFQPVIWDLNMAFGGFNASGEGGLLKLADMQSLDPILHQNSPEWPLIHQIISQPKWGKRYRAHLKTILYENITNKSYRKRAEELRALIDPHVLEDSNALYPYEAFQNNIHHPVFSRGFRTGIEPLMKERADFLIDHPLIKPIGPIFRNPGHSPTFPHPNDSVTISVENHDTDQVWIGMRAERFAPFIESKMYDDGQHGDGAANDGIWGIKLKVEENISYYFYAENDEIGRFLPARAQFEFFTIKVFDRTQTPPIVINEFLAENADNQSDQNGEYDDWIEFFNTTTEDISLTSYGLSDNRNQPFQWTFPDTMIKAGEYLIVWADGEIGQEGLHTNFRIDKAGERLRLVAPDSSLVDSINFPAQDTDISWGRFPNGFGSFSRMNPTFGFENDFHTDIEKPFKEKVSIFPNPARDQVEIQFPQNQRGQLEIFNIHGQMILQKKINTDRFKLILKEWESGFYVVKMNGEMVGKLVKN